MRSCAEDEKLGRFFCRGSFFLQEVHSIILKPILHDVLIK